MGDPGRSRAASPPGAVEPRYFGRSRLFGCFQAGARARAAVVCHPLGHEYVTLHRALRQLATQIARQGIGVLRFDYSGTGDSPGRLADARLGAWRQEVGEAIDEARRLTGAERVALVGVRLGAVLALAAARERTDVGALALWDPVIWGRSYLSELARLDRRMRRHAHVAPDPEGRSRPRPDGEREVLGFPLAEPLIEDIRAIELDNEPPPDVDRILLLESRTASTAPLGASLRAAGLGVDSHCEPHHHLWSWHEDITKVELPHASIRRLAAWTVEALK